MGDSDISVKELGRYYVSGNSGTHTLAVYTTAGSQIGCLSINMESGTADGLGYKYATLSSPITLTANTSYYIVSLEASGGDQWWGHTTLPLLTATAVATINKGVFYDNGVWYEATTSSTGNSYVPLNFKY